MIARTIRQVDAIILTPEGGELSIHLKGDLAGISTLAQSKAKSLAEVAKGSGSRSGTGPQQVLQAKGNLVAPSRAARLGQPNTSQPPNTPNGTGNDTNDACWGCLRQWLSLERYFNSLLIVVSDGLSCSISSMIWFMRG